MSTLVLARPGQACAFTDEADRLSPLRWQQARRLGRFWLEHGVRFDAAYHGTLRRQRKIFAAVSAEFKRAGPTFPQAEVLPGLDEYGTQDLVSVVAPRLAESDLEFAALWDAWQSNQQDSDRNRPFQLMSEGFVSRWVEGRLPEPCPEAWNTFRRCAGNALLLTRESLGRGDRVAAFTAGNPIGVTVQACLRAPTTAVFELDWRVRNTSLTTFR